MKTAFCILALLHTCMHLEISAEEEPFGLLIVPESRGAESATISMAKDSENEFYVVLTNKSDKEHSVFEAWNSWGYQAISFEVILPSQERHVIRVKPQIFTVNAPAIHMIPPKGHYVFPITLNDEWDMKFQFGKPGATKVKLAAVYEVGKTKESEDRGVWVGRVVSKSIEVQVRHW